MMPINSLLLAQLKAASEMQNSHTERQNQNRLNQQQSLQRDLLIQQYQSDDSRRSLLASLANPTARDYYEKYMAAAAVAAASNQHHQHLSNQQSNPFAQFEGSSQEHSHQLNSTRSTSSNEMTTSPYNNSHLTMASKNALDLISVANPTDAASLVYHNNQQQSSQASRPTPNFACQLMGQHSKRKRRHRTIFSEEQLAQLESVFCHTQYPDVTLREQLAAHINLKEARIEVWFKNRRAKLRKNQRDSQHPVAALGPNAVSMLGHQFFANPGINNTMVGSPFPAALAASLYSREKPEQQN